MDYKVSEVKDNLHNCTRACIGPTPPNKLGNWFFLISWSHSFKMNVTNLSKPSNLQINHVTISTM